jgi:hypothetical protein
MQSWDSKIQGLVVKTEIIGKAWLFIKPYGLKFKEGGNVTFNVCNSQ